MLISFLFPVFHETFLYDYVVGKSFPKMMRRVNHPITLHLIANLTGVTICPKEIFSETLSTSSGARVSNVQCILTLKMFHARAGDSCGDVSRLLESLGPMPEGKGVYQELYSEVSCIHFHRALLALFAGFKNSLGSLFKAMKCLSETLVSETNLQRLIRQVQLWGLALQAMVYSDALRTHLTAINRWLTHPSKMNNPNNRDGEDDGDDSELQAICDDQEISLASQAFLEGLRLTVSYFQSVVTIRKFLRKSRPESIFINTISIPHQGDTMLSWKESLARWLPLKGDVPSDLSIETIESAVKVLKERQGSSRVLSSLSEGGSLYTGKGFTGTVHCEACMATFMHLARVKSPELGVVNRRLELLIVECHV